MDYNLRATDDFPISPNQTSFPPNFIYLELRSLTPIILTATWLRALFVSAFD